jgi:hypothetical protein
MLLFLEALSIMADVAKVDTQSYYSANMLGIVRAIYYFMLIFWGLGFKTAIHFLSIPRDRLFSHCGS